MTQILKNNVSGALSTQLNPADISMVLVDASNFPAPLGGDFYLLTLVGLNTNGQEATWEVVKVTAKASNTLTVVRAQESTAAATWPAGATVQLRLTAGTVATQDALVSGLATKEPTIAVGTTAQYRRGDKTWQTLDKAAAGLPNVDNTADSAKPVSTAQQTALNLKANLASPAFTGTPTGITKAHVGLGNVDNTSDVSKPVSTAQALADTAAKDRANHTGALNFSWAVSEYTGSANVLLLTPAYTRAAYAIGDVLRFRAFASNTAAATINVGGLGARTAVTITGAALPPGYIRIDVDTVCVYDGAKFVVGRDGERGSNANGEYVREANGTQFCAVAGVLPGRPLSADSELIMPWPAAFADKPNVVQSLTRPVATSWTPVAEVTRNGLAQNSTSLSFISQYYTYVVATVDVGVTAIAVGRWYQ